MSNKHSACSVERREASCDMRVFSVKGSPADKRNYLKKAFVFFKCDLTIVNKKAGRYKNNLFSSTGVCSKIENYL